MWLKLSSVAYLQVWFGELLQFADDGAESSVDMSVDQLVLIAGQVFLKLSECSLSDR